MGDRELWGIVVSRRFHIALGLLPACGSSRVAELMDAQRAEWRKLPGVPGKPIFGYVGDRPVCRKCIRATRNKINYLEEDLAMALKQNDRIGL